MAIVKKKISELPICSTLVGLWTIGVDSTNRSVKVSLEFIKKAYDDVVKATNDAVLATKNAMSATTAANTATNSANSAATNANTAKDNAVTATQNAVTAATNANTATQNANTATGGANRATEAALAAANDAKTNTVAAGKAAELAGGKAIEAQVTIVRLEELEKSLIAAAKMMPTGMTLEYLKVITFRNTLPQRIKVSLTPAGYSNNVLFLGDDKAVGVAPDGTFTIKEVGVSKVHVIPTENTSLYQTVAIQVVQPGLRKVRANSLRLTNNGLRLN